MNKNAMELLEYDRIKEKLMEYAVSEQGRELLNKVEPSIDIVEIEGWMKETTEARAILDRSSSIPIHSLKGVENIMAKIAKGSILLPEELSGLLGLLKDGRRLKKFMEDKEAIAPAVSSYAFSIYELTGLEEEIERCIVNSAVDDKATPELSKIRRKIALLEDKIKSKIDGVLRNPAYRSYIQDSVVSMRGGRYVIPVKNEFRKYIDGSILDSSASGSTVFIEPAEVRKAHDELDLCRIAEENEVYRILSTLTAMVEQYSREVKINIEVMANYDFLFAKAKLSRFYDGRHVKLNNQNIIDIREGRHPLLTCSAVPLDFTIGNGYRSLVITGPNTGGKTVALKTVGLLTMMAQSGLHVPVGENSEFAVFADILADVGDGQSIEQSLSTFSSHIKNIISITECADSHSLVLMDELGAGTDPGEGMGIAVAVLEEIYRKGATILATTHYSEIKEFAMSHEGFKNGCMEFDINTLKPLYRLSIGKAGESNALLIALRLGMNEHIIERAHEVTYKEKREYKKFMPAENNTVENNEDIKIHDEQVQKLKETIEKRERVEKKKITPSFSIGDCVNISSMGRTGIVCETENSKGEVGVMVMKKKIKVNKKRLSIYIDSSELYPEDYDFDIIFESKENRKKDKQMSKHHVEGLTIEVEKQ